jgi:hypothetical protein
MSAVRLLAALAALRTQAIPPRPEPLGDQRATLGPPVCRHSFGVGQRRCRCGSPAARPRSARRSTPAGARKPTGRRCQIAATNAEEPPSRAPSNVVFPGSARFPRRSLSPLGAERRLLHVVAHAPAPEGRALELLADLGHGRHIEHLTSAWALTPPSPARFPVLHGGPWARSGLRQRRLVSVPRGWLSRLGSRPGLPAGWPRPSNRVRPRRIRYSQPSMSP